MKKYKILKIYYMKNIHLIHIINIYMTNSYCENQNKICTHKYETIMTRKRIDMPLILF